MKSDPSRTKRLILEAHELLEQDNVDERAKNVLANCLKTIKDSQHLTPEETREIDKIIVG